MPKIIPHHNVEYTFRVNKTFVRLIYLGEDAKGRYIFENVQYKNLTRITKKSFPYWHSKLLLSKRELTVPDNDVIAQKTKKMLKTRILELKKTVYPQGLIQEVKATTGLTPEIIISDLQMAIYNVSRNTTLVSSALSQYNHFKRALQTYRGG